MYDSIIFDLDGTLWDSTHEVAEAYNKVINEKYPDIPADITAERLKGLFGLPMDVIAERLFSNVSREHALEIMDECGEYECMYLAEHGAKLFEGVEDTLRSLNEKYKLFIVSNCQDGYIESFLKANPQFCGYFIDYENPGRSGKLKADNIKLVIERNNLINPVYVGDTEGDAKAAREAGIPFIYAGYGFGDVKEYQERIDSFNKLLIIL